MKFGLFVLAALSFSSSSYAFVLCPNGDCATPTMFDVSTENAGPIEPIYADIFKSVAADSLDHFLRDTTGVNPVTVNGQTFSITDRYAPASKQMFRDYFIQYFKSLGASVQEMPYKTKHHNHEVQGHNVEAILTGQSKDSIVIIVHYDSIGPMFDPTGNPGVDDDMTGMSTLLETARILSHYSGKLQHTVRFVAADYEEWLNPGLEGARTYAQYIQNLAKQENFKIVAAIDNEQSGWNCAAQGGCRHSQGEQFSVFSCGGRYDYSALGDELTAVAGSLSSLGVQRGCMGENSDHYAMWEIGVPAVVYSENDPFDNPHFDQKGGDTYDKIDRDYFFKIAQIGVTFAAKLVGISQ